jgi:hypothetical protein
MLEKSLHFPIKPGVVAAWDTRTVVIIALLDASCTRVRDVATGEQHDVPVKELQGIPAIGQIESNERRWALLRDSTRAAARPVRVR